MVKGRTSVIIAHRLSTIQRADKIIVMHKGQLREMGTHRTCSRNAESISSYTNFNITKDPRKFIRLLRLVPRLQRMPTTSILHFPISFERDIFSSEVVLHSPAR